MLIHDANHATPLHNASLHGDDDDAAAQQQQTPPLRQAQQQQRQALVECRGCCAAQPVEGEWRDVFGDPVRPRRNGFEWPPDVLQVAAWACIVVLLTLHYTAQVPFLAHRGNAVFVALLVVSSVLAGATVCMKLTLELLSQVDTAVFDATLPRLTQDELFDLTPPSSDKTLPCYFCRRFVSESSKHCGICDKCVTGFDHHCRWLNGCIGARNYRLFVAFMLTSWLALVWVAAVSVYVLCDALLDRVSFANYMATHAYHSPTAGNAHAGALIAVLVVNFVCLAMACAGVGALSKLIGFHVFLWYTGQTTYDHITRRRERRRSRQQDAEQQLQQPQQQQQQQQDGVDGSQAGDGTCCHTVAQADVSTAAPASHGPATVDAAGVKAVRVVCRRCATAPRRRDFRKHGKLLTPAQQRKKLQEERQRLQRMQHGDEVSDVFHSHTMQNMWSGSHNTSDEPVYSSSATATTLKPSTTTMMVTTAAAEAAATATGSSPSALMRRHDATVGVAMPATSHSVVVAAASDNHGGKGNTNNFVSHGVRDEQQPQPPAPPQPQQPRRGRRQRQQGVVDDDDDDDDNNPFSALDHEPTYV